MTTTQVNTKPGNLSAAHQVDANLHIGDVIRVSNFFSDTEYTVTREAFRSGHGFSIVAETEAGVPKWFTAV